MSKLRVERKYSVETAREQGIKALAGYTDPSNQPMIRLFKKLPYEISTS